MPKNNINLNGTLNEIDLRHYQQMCIFSWPFYNDWLNDGKDVLCKYKRCMFVCRPLMSVRSNSILFSNELMSFLLLAIHENKLFSWKKEKCHFSNGKWTTIYIAPTYINSLKHKSEGNNFSTPVEFVSSLTKKDRISTKNSERNCIKIINWFACD